MLYICYVCIFVYLMAEPICIISQYSGNTIFILITHLLFLVSKDFFLYTLNVPPFMRWRIPWK